MRRASTYTLAGNQTTTLSHRQNETGENDFIYRRFSLPANRRHDPSMKIAEMKAQTLTGLFDYGNYRICHKYWGTLSTPTRFILKFEIVHSTTY